MKNDLFQNISKIIERDSKSSTYKFALLRGTIDIIQDNSPYIKFSAGRVHFPMGLLIEKWLTYYYPILDSDIPLPQINGNGNLAFELQFRKIIKDYRLIGGLSVFYHDLMNRGIPRILQKDFIDLVKKLNNVITQMPMRHIGFSLSNEQYSIYKYERGNYIKYPSYVDIEYLINGFGTFSIPLEYYEPFKFLGSFISGQDSILFKWAEFSVNASGKRLSVENVVNEVLKSPITERDVAESKKMYRRMLDEKGKVYCVWTGDQINRYDIDHMIPFSVWKNNDLWNLLPSKTTINNQKKDKIPSPEMIEKRRDFILYYWNLVREYQPGRFQKEMQVALLGNNSFDHWPMLALKQLKERCNYLIANRGYSEWNMK